MGRINHFICSPQYGSGLPVFNAGEVVENRVQVIIDEYRVRFKGFRQLAVSYQVGIYNDG